MNLPDQPTQLHNNWQIQYSAMCC